MDLNPISWIVDGAASMVSSYQTSKQARVEAKATVQNKKTEYKIAKWSAKIDMLKSRAQHDADYDMQVLKNRRFTWLDEALGVSIILMTASAFIPGLAPYVKEGWEAVSQAPFWFQFAWYTLIASTLGGLTVLRVLMGMRKKGGASLPQIATAGATSTDPSSRQGTPPQRESTDQQVRSKSQTSESRTKFHRQDHTTSPSNGDESPQESPSQSPEEQEQDRPSRVPGPPHGGGR